MMSDQTDYSDAISSIEDIIEDARAGRMFILVDHEDRENEGDLVIPAQGESSYGMLERRKLSWTPACAGVTKEEQ